MLSCLRKLSGTSTSSSSKVTQPRVAGMPEAVIADSISSHAPLIDATGDFSMTEDGASVVVDREVVVILDCGAQYGKVIDRRCRELNVESVIEPLQTSVATLWDKYPHLKAIILSGGPSSVSSDSAPLHDPVLFSAGIPILGICYGFHMINRAYGGMVESGQLREDGVEEIDVDTTNPIFKSIDEQRQRVLLTHGDCVGAVPDGLAVIARSGAMIAGVADEGRRIYGLQFHPEVDLTTHGVAMLRNFLFGIASCAGTFTMKSREGECIAEIRRIVGNLPTDPKVLLLVSGGVDSTVCAALLQKAIGKERVVAVHIDHGFMRKDESRQVDRALRDCGVHLRVHHCGPQFRTSRTRIVVFHNGEQREMFTQLLCQETDPERKRRIIGDTFMYVKDELIDKLELDPDSTFLAQGTLRPDLIESASSLASSNAAAIKTHHNDTELVRQLRAMGRVVEPLKDFHKDEVRQLGRDLGLPEDIVMRHPFPGPGLAIRILCQLEPHQCPLYHQTSMSLKALCTYDSFVDKGITDVSSGISGTDWPPGLTQTQRQHLRAITARTAPELRPCLLPVKSVGVQGDGRSYSYVAAISSTVEPPPWNQLFDLAHIIPKVCHNINRVCYVFGPPIADAVRLDDITPTLLTMDVVSRLRECDAVAMQALKAHKALDKISQMPVVMIPVHFDRTGTSIPSVRRSVVIRTFITQDFMTGRPAIPGVDIGMEVIDDCRRAMECLPGISRVLYDLTAKPPGTTEWE